MPLVQLQEQLGTALWLAACAIALWRGRLPERLVAAALLLDLASVVLLPGLSHAREAVNWWTAMGDVAVLGVMVAVACYDRPTWLLIGIGFQTVAVLAHAPRMLDASIHGWVYAVVTNLCGYTVAVTPALGALSRLRKEPDPVRPGR